MIVVRKDKRQNKKKLNLYDFKLEKLSISSKIINKTFAWANLLQAKIIDKKTKRTFTLKDRKKISFHLPQKEFSSKKKKGFFLYSKDESILYTTWYQ